MKRLVLDRLLACRTEAMGGHRYHCADCGWETRHFHSCRDRHCPQCHSMRAVAWVEDRSARMLPCGHFQVVFTLPSELRRLVLFAPRLMYDGLMRVAAATLQDVLKTEHQARFAITSVLHTWNRELGFHPHVHFVVSAVGLHVDDDRIVDVGDFLVSNRKLAPFFAGRMLAWIRKARTEGRLVLRGAVQREWVQVLDACANKDAWVIDVEPPRGRMMASLLKYLARYLYRVAVDDRRIVSFDGETVVLRTRGKATIRLSAAEFTRRFLLHVLPKGFRKVRHFGLLASGNLRRLEKARSLLWGGVAPTNVVLVVDGADEEAPEDWSCPDCGGAVQGAPFAAARGPPVPRRPMRARTT